MEELVASLCVTIFLLIVLLAMSDVARRLNAKAAKWAEAKKQAAEQDRQQNKCQFMDALGKLQEEGDLYRSQVKMLQENLQLEASARKMAAEQLDGLYSALEKERADHKEMRRLYCLVIEERDKARDDVISHRSASHAERGASRRKLNEAAMAYENLRREYQAILAENKNAANETARLQQRLKANEELAGAMSYNTAEMAKALGTLKDCVTFAEKVLENTVTDSSAQSAQTGS